MDKNKFLRFWGKTVFLIVNISENHLFKKSFLLSQKNQKYEAPCENLTR